MKKKRITITYVQCHTLWTTIKQKYGGMAPDQYVKHIAADLSQELEFQVSAHAVTRAFDYFNIPRKGHRGVPAYNVSIKDHTIDLLRKQIGKLESKISTLEGPL